MSNGVKMNLGPTVRAIRKEKGITLEQVSRLTGIHTGNLSKQERGEQGYTLQALSDVATAVGSSIADVLEQAGYKKENQMSNEVKIEFMPNLVTIEVMLLCYYMGEVSTMKEDFSQSKMNALRFLGSHGMIDDEFKPTEKGQVWVEAIKKVPLPTEVRVFEIPQLETA